MRGFYRQCKQPSNTLTGNHKALGEHLGRINRLHLFRTHRIKNYQYVCVTYDGVQRLSCAVTPHGHQVAS